MSSRIRIPTRFSKKKSLKSKVPGDLEQRRLSFKINHVKVASEDEDDLNPKAFLEEDELLAAEEAAARKPKSRKRKKQIEKSGLPAKKRTRK